MYVCLYTRQRGPYRTTCVYVCACVRARVRAYMCVCVRVCASACGGAERSTFSEARAFGTERVSLKGLCRISSAAFIALPYALLASTLSGNSGTRCVYLWEKAFEEQCVHERARASSVKLSPRTSYCVTHLRRYRSFWLNQEGESTPN
jgi:hypothetical protein